jgi:TRAP-type mannitol/chloroaromatic compound transport system substrate-binding protein
MRKDCHLVTISLFLCLLLPLSTLAMAKKVNAQAPIEWKLQCYFQSKASMAYMNEFIDRVKEKSNGKLLIKGYSANQLVKTMGVLDAVSKGAVEIGWGTGIYHKGKIPEAGIEFGLDFSWETWPEQKELFYEWGLMEKVREAYADYGIYFLSPHPAGPYLLMTKNRIEGIADLKGLKLRGTGMEANILHALGASVISMPGSEQYMALQRGTVDGTVYVGLALEMLKLNEVVNYVYYPAFIKPTTDIYVNLKDWNSLTPDLQKVLQESMEGMLDKMNEGYDAQDALGLMRSLVDGSVRGAIRFPDDDVAKMRAAAMVEWDKVAAKSPRCKEMVDMVKNWMKEKGRL